VGLKVPLIKGIETDPAKIEVQTCGIHNFKLIDMKTRKNAIVEYVKQGRTL